MMLPISNIQNVLRTYDRQLNVARLNSEIKRPVVQGQVDRVEISDEGRQMLEKKPQTVAPASKRNVHTTASKPLNDLPETLAAVTDDDF